MWNKFSSSRLVQIVFTAILLLGLGLRFYFYLMGRSLWDDETHLALNFMDHGFARLFKPLDYIQIAPILFILAEKAIASVFGYGELALRAFPFICSVLSLPLIYFITRDLTGRRLTALIAFFIFSVNLALIYFSSELKQYTVELAVYLLLVYLTVSTHSIISDRRNRLLAIAGSISIFFSGTAIIVLAAIASYYLYDWYQQKKINWKQARVFVLWMIFFLLNFFFFIYKHPATSQQQTNYADMFCPTDVLSCEFVQFLKKTIDETFFRMLLYISKDWGFGWILFILSLLAARTLIRNRDHAIFFLVCLPVLLHLFLSALKLYPFWYRLILYLVPCFIIFLSIGLTKLFDFLRRKLHVALGAAALLYCLYFFTKESFRQFPLWYREIKPSLAYVNDSLPQNAHVYIFDPAHAYTYYYKRGFVKNKIHREVPWELELPEYHDIVFEERSNYLLFYSTLYQWGYRKVLDDLKKKGLIVKTFEYKGYAVSEVRPFELDPGLVKRVDHSYFDPALRFAEDNALAVWSGDVSSKTFPLKAGRYQISVLTRGTKARGVYPQNELFINDQLIGKFESPERYREISFPFELKNDLDASFRIRFLNDTIAGVEDRNVFIKAINIRRDSTSIIKNND